MSAVHVRDMHESNHANNLKEEKVKRKKACMTLMGCPQIKRWMERETMFYHIYRLPTVIENLETGSRH